MAGNDMTTNGIDVSKWDAAALDWGKTGLAFTFIKAGEGLSSDPLFSAQWDAAKGHVLRGAYHYFRASISPVLAAQHLIDLLGGDQGGLPPVLDLENRDGMTGHDVLEAARSWLTVVEQGTGRKPIIYTSWGFWNVIGGATEAWAADYPLWLAQWPWDTASQPDYDVFYAQLRSGERHLPTPRVPAPWTKYAFWQWTSRGKPGDIPGYPVGKKAVDLDIFNGSLAELRQFAGVDPLPPLTLEERLDRLETWARGQGYGG